MKRYIIAGNWKMNMSKGEAISFFQNISQNKDLKKKDNVTAIICPVFPLLTLSQEAGQKVNILIGAQNVSNKEKGAFTGEVSAEILKSIEIPYCIIGHSERRQYYGDTDEVIKQKWLLLRNNSINPIICIGETLQERESGATFDVIKTQITAIFKEMDLTQPEDLIIAYEPVWAIGTGKTATPEMAQEVHKYIRDLMKELYDEKGCQIPLLYGGSVNPANIKDLLTQNDIDGALIGGASLKPTDFATMIQIAGEL